MGLVGECVPAEALWGTSVVTSVHGTLGAWGDVECRTRNHDTGASTNDGPFLPRRALLSRLFFMRV